MEALRRERLAAYATGATASVCPRRAVTLEGRRPPGWTGALPRRAGGFSGWARHRLRRMADQTGYWQTPARPLEIEIYTDATRDTMGMVVLFVPGSGQRDHVDPAKYKELGLPDDWEWDGRESTMWSRSSNKH